MSKNGGTVLHVTAGHGHATVTEKLIPARCNVDLQDQMVGYMPFGVMSLSFQIASGFTTSRCHVDLQGKTHDSSDMFMPPLAPGVIPPLQVALEELGFCRVLETRKIKKSPPIGKEGVYKKENSDFRGEKTNRRGEKHKVLY